jgi:hypothetical protein
MTVIPYADFRRMQIQHENETIVWIYFFWNETTGLFKIGQSIDPERRCRELSSIMGMRLDLLFSFQAPAAAEKIIHDFMTPYRHSHEWFKGDEIEQLSGCFEDFDVESGMDSPILSAEDVEFVLNDWANSYGRRNGVAVETACEDRGGS